MAWTASKIFTSLVTDRLNATGNVDMNADTFNVALYSDAITPSQSVASASTAYNAGVWATGHITDTGTSAPAGWPTVGRPLVTPTSTFASNVYTFDAADTVSANAVTTIAGTYGCQVYSDTSTTVIDQGICYCYFGGSQSVTLGTFTIAWNAAGILSLTL